MGSPCPTSHFVARRKGDHSLHPFKDASRLIAQAEWTCDAYELPFYYFTFMCPFVCATPLKRIQTCDKLVHVEAG